jgi:Cdc6-like AAA superfamily ATPase
MNLNASKQNSIRLTAEMQWLSQVIDTRMKIYWKRESEYNDIKDISFPNEDGDTSLFGEVVRYYKMDLYERVILLLALAPHIMPNLLDVFFVKNADYDRGFTEFGGAKGQTYGGFIPTGETAAFILTANDMANRFYLLNLFREDHFFRKFNILKLVHLHGEEPFLSGIITLSNEYLSYFTHGEPHKPDFSIHFPAKRLYTQMDWDDLVLADDTMEEVEEIKSWLEYGDILLNDWELGKKIKPGFKSLFYGAPGTGKTLTASLLGKSAELDVYRIDLSMVVSKYIGETEKNLANVFDQAENKNWILFFDEADALFGKRTQTSSSNDRYANQEVSYLLQRIEDYPGVIILATNIRANLDDAFSRRFQSMIYFALPDAQQRLRLWQNGFSHKSSLEASMDLDAMAQKYEMSGGAITNVVRYASMRALKRGDAVIMQKDILAGIRKEYAKEGKIV